MKRAKQSCRPRNLGKNYVKAAENRARFPPEHFRLSTVIKVEKARAGMSFCNSCDKQSLN